MVLAVAIPRRACVGCVKWVRHLANMSHTGLGSGPEMGPGSEEGAHGLFPTSSCNAKAGVAMERRGKEKCVSRPEDRVSHLRNRQLHFHSRGQTEMAFGHF